MEPEVYIMSAYATKAEAIEFWKNLVGNDKLVVVGLNIGLGSFNPAAKEVAWMVLPRLAFH